MEKVKEHYNHWTVLYKSKPLKNGDKNCVVRCDCGRLFLRTYSMIKTGRSKMCRSCSVKITKNRTKHGMAHTRLYKIWNNIKHRCGKDKNYVDVSYCLEWKDFEKFYKWAMENGYQDNLTIERINSNGNYCPENCRWATLKEQARNTNRNVFIVFKGRKITVGELAEISGLKYNTVWARLKRGWSVEDSVKGIK